MKKAFTKQRKTHATFMYIPESESRVLSLRIPLWVPAATVISIFLLLFLACASFHILQSTSKSYDKSKDEITRLVDLNNLQGKKIEKLQTDALQIRLQLDENIKALNEIKKVLDSEENVPLVQPTTTDSSINTPDDTLQKLNQAQTSYEELSKAVLSQKKSIDRSMVTARNYKTWLSSTPSIKPVQNTTITASYGYRKNPFTNRGIEFHKGVDFSGDIGTPVVATADGVVLFSGWQSGYGKVVILSHNNGITTLYGHNSKLLVKKGDKVKKEQTISEIGSTGRSTGAHLHYEVRVNGKLVNPSNYY